MDLQPQAREYRCPLCDSLLNREKWVKITGQWEDNKKQIDENKKLLEKSRKEKAAIEKQAAIDKKKAVREAAKKAAVEGMEQGRKKEKNEREKMTKMWAKTRDERDKLNKRVAELEKQVKEGKTPQGIGFDFEKQVLRLLSETFLDDKVESTGKMGDVRQFVMMGDEIVGVILYECKNTTTYKNDFIKEITRHQETARADYAVIVTHAQKKDKSKFFLDGNIIVIDPMGLLDLAYLLRTTLIDIHRQKLTKEDAKHKGLEVLRYMQKGDFKKYMVGNIDQARKAFTLLLKEVDQHKSNWKERAKIYYTIHQNTQNVRKSIGEIVTGKPIGPSELESFPISEVQEIHLLETGEIINSDETA